LRAYLPKFAASFAGDVRLNLSFWPIGMITSLMRGLPRRLTWIQGRPRCLPRRPERRLRSVPGVSEINTWGGLTQQYQVLADPRQLDRFGLTLHQLLQAIADNNASFGGGFIEHRSERYTVRGVGQDLQIFPFRTQYAF